MDYESDIITSMLAAFNDIRIGLKEKNRAFCDLLISLSFPAMPQARLERSFKKKSFRFETNKNEMIHTIIGMFLISQFYVQQNGCLWIVGIH